MITSCMSMVACICHLISSATAHYFFKKYCVADMAHNTIFFLKKNNVLWQKNKVGDTCHHTEGYVLHNFWCRSLEWGLLRKQVKYNSFVTFSLSHPFLLPPTPSSNLAANIHALWLVWRGLAQGRSFWSWDDEWHYLGKICPKNHPKGALIGIFKPNYQNLKIAISPKPYIISVQNLMTKLTPSTTHQSRTWHTTWLTSAILKINITL